MTENIICTGQNAEEKKRKTRKTGSFDAKRAQVAHELLQWCKRHRLVFSLPRTKNTSTFPPFLLFVVLTAKEMLGVFFATCSPTVFYVTSVECSDTASKHDGSFVLSTHTCLCPHATVNDRTACGTPVL